MIVTASKRVHVKISMLSAKHKDSLKKFVDFSKDADKAVIQRKSRLMENRIYLYSLADLRIFFEFTSDSSIRIVDLILEPQSALISLPSNRNPKYNSQINPKYNSQINPKYNSQINPKYNSQINPKYNSQINPKYNSQINPKYNSQINPKYNSQINPKYNSQINPKYNSQINPQLNPSFNGFYSFDLDGNHKEFLILSGSVLLAFNYESLNLAYFAVDHSGGGYSLFDTKNTYIGHFESNGSGGFNVFDKNQNWTGFVK